MVEDHKFIMLYPLWALWPFLFTFWLEIVGERRVLDTVNCFRCRKSLKSRNHFIQTQRLRDWAFLMPPLYYPTASTAWFFQEREFQNNRRPQRRSNSWPPGFKRENSKANKLILLISWKLCSSFASFFSILESFYPAFHQNSTNLSLWLFLLIIMRNNLETRLCLVFFFGCCFALAFYFCQ